MICINLHLPKNDDIKHMIDLYSPNEHFSCGGYSQLVIYQGITFKEGKPLSEVLLVAIGT